MFAMISLLILLVLFCFSEGQLDFTIGNAAKRDLSSDFATRISCDDKVPRFPFYFSVLTCMNVAKREMFYDWLPVPLRDQ